MGIDEAVVRHIKADELGDLLDLYRHLHNNDAPLPEAEDLNRFWDEALANPMLHYLVAEADQRVVASCILAIIPNLTRGARPYGLIENVVTHEDYRRCGLGTAVLRHALKTAWDTDCYKVMLLTGSTDPGVHEFYQRAGFQRGVKTGFVAEAPAEGQ